jgi:hypothetical protein
LGAEPPWRTELLEPELLFDEELEVEVDDSLPERDELLLDDVLVSEPLREELVDGEVLTSRSLRVPLSLSTRVVVVLPEDSTLEFVSLDVRESAGVIFTVVLVPVLILREPVVFESFSTGLFTVFSVRPCVLPSGLVGIADVRVPSNAASRFTGWLRLP